jgi:hypothetical protein
MIRRTRWYGKQRSAAILAYACICLSYSLILVKAAGTAIPSFTSRLISDNLAAGMSPIHDEEDIKGVAGTLYGGAFVLILLIRALDAHTSHGSHFGVAAADTVCTTRHEVQRPC